jgi:imidazolonepropionase-like amidohydrolase
MLLDQAAAEAAPGAVHADGDERVLSAAGRAAFARYLGAGRVAFSVTRVSDIRQALAYAKAHNIRPVIVGGGQAAQVADELAAAKASVLISPFDSLPGSFDDLGTALTDARRLDAAGVRVAFTTGEVHNARKNRQGAGIAVAYGMPWESALKALTANPAEMFGQGAERGRIAAGLAADLTLWSGDPFELDTFADQVWIGGKAQSLRSRQDELRDRYLPERPAMPRAYPVGR